MAGRTDHGMIRHPRMSPTPDSTLADPQQIIADLRGQLDERTRLLNERTAELAARNSAYSERIQHQAAANDVLKVMSASPADPQPVFDLIVERARDLCGGYGVTVFEFDGALIHWRAATGVSDDPVVREAYEAMFPMAPTRELPAGLAIIDRQVIHIRDTETEPGLNPAIRHITAKSSVTVPLMRGEVAIGALSLGSRERGGFSGSQIELLQTFAEQAVIAITGAETYRELRQRTDDLQESLEYQTATSDVLKVISRSTFDLQPVLDTVCETAAKLCAADMAYIYRLEGGLNRPAASFGFPPEFTESLQQIGPRPPRRGSITGRTILEGRIIHVPDILADPEFDVPQAIALGVMRTALGVPLMREGVVVGTISLARQRVEPFTERQIELVRTFADQAVIAIENARLITETREALDQQTATAEVLQVINSSPGDLAPVFDAMLEKAMRLCEAAFGYLMTYDGERFETVAHHGLPAGFAEYLPRMHQPSPSGLYARVLAGAPFAHADDLKEGEVYRTSRLRQALVDIGGARTGIVVALRKDETVLGIITIYRQEVRPFTEKQIALLQNFAAQAVIAMENARLITETQEALEQQTATAEVLGVINSSPGDLAPVFEAMLDKALHLCGAAFGYLATYDGERFHHVGGRGLPPAFTNFLREWRPWEPGSAALRLVRGEAFVHIADLLEDESVGQGASVRRAMMEMADARTQLMVSLRKDDALLGMFVIFRHEMRPFTDKQIALVQNFAAQAVIAIENARLPGELRQRTEEVGELNRNLEARVAEQVDELGRVGRLKRFLAPQLAELIVSQGDEKILESHRREIVVVFCDLRGYTAFTETAEPEEVLEFLRQYHGALGPLVSQFEGTLDQFSGDGIMVFFNDPVPIPDPAERAVKMAVAMREQAGKLITTWRRDGCELGFGAGIAQGYATLGQIGFSERSGYTAIGTVCNLAARLCAEAKDGQILIGSRVARAVEAVARLEDLGNLGLKGLRRPVAAFNVVQSTSSAEARPNLTVVAKGPGV